LKINLSNKQLNPYDERLELYYNNVLIFEGRADKLITSNNATREVQMCLNFGKEEHKVTAKLFFSKILWIPEYNIKELRHDYTNIWFDKTDFNELWTNLRYDPSKDLEQIRNIAMDELKAFWFNGNRVHGFLGMITEWGRMVNSNIVAFSSDDLKLENVLRKLVDRKWEGCIFHETNFSVQNMVPIIAYFEDGSEWTLAVINSNNEIFLSLATDFYIKII